MTDEPTVNNDGARLAVALMDTYRIDRAIGAGGMATVYLAEDLKHQRRVAIKVLKPELAATIGHDRFLREITTTANLRHPHILPLFDSGEAGGFLYYAMPLVEGESLRERLVREKQLPVDVAVQITGEIADALEYAHGRGVIHRDIKPENILLERGHAVVADFGIARAVTAAGSSTLTQVGSAIGTPSYMSPEQASGEQDLDARSDQYALACLAYEMLAGQPPFMGPTAESLIIQHLAAPPRPVTQLRSAVPVHVADALQRALAKSAADRFASMSDFRAAIGAGKVATTPRSRRRMSLRQKMGIGALGVLIVAAGLWYSSRNRPIAAELDADIIAVLPFRVGGNASIAYLRESMLDLLQARLSGGTGLRTLEPRTLLAAWRRTVANENEDLSEDASRSLAAELGAGRVLLGSAVSTPTELTLSGSLIDVGNGALLARESVSGAPDSIAVLVNRLTAALLIGGEGKLEDRRANLAQAPIDALQSYLAGRKEYRRGNYFGAMNLYRKALERDSSFVDAAFSMVATNAWIGTVFETAGYDVIPTVWEMRDRLGARDRDLFLAMPAVGPAYPAAAEYAAIIEHADRAASNAADSPEHWTLLGQLLSQYGAAASQQNWRQRSADALDRAIALDPSFAIAVGARIHAAIADQDSATVSKLGAQLETQVDSGFADDFYLWAAARMRGDSVAALRWRTSSAEVSRRDHLQKLVKIALFGVQLGLPLDDSRYAVEILKRDAVSGSERGGMVLSDLAVRFAEGRVELGDVDQPYGPGWAATLIQQALIEPTYRRVAQAMVAKESAGQYRIPAPSGDIRWPPLQLCQAQLLRLTGGDTTGAALAVRELRKFATTDRPPVPTHLWRQTEHRICPLLLEVLLDDGGPPSSARAARIDELDALMQRGPRSFASALGTSPTAFANFTIARLREKQGDIPAALAAIRRRESDAFPTYLWSRPAFLRHEGRLAALSGDTAGAKRAYDEYLRMRTNPDAPFRAQRDSVIAERAALDGRRNAKTPPQ